MTEQATLIAERLKCIKNEITRYEQQFDRQPNQVQLIAVSKKKPVSDITTAYENGQRIFAENYVQEAVDKVNALKHLRDIQWHFIGPLQSNKTKHIAEHFDWLHSLDRIKIAKRINEQRGAYQAPLNVCVQINIDEESNKTGILATETIDFIGELSSLTKIVCRGLMVIPKATEDKAQTIDSFAKTQNLFHQCRQKFDTIDTLSMGMSSDIEQAIQYGSTMVRVGTALFGARD